MHEQEPTPHYLRFARALALAGALGAATSGCCPMIPDSVACGHCTCAWQTRSVSAPLACSTIHREAECCPPPVIGPLAPPDLPA
jgi:hypothetical protein